jgi:hypothetical protein
MKHIFKVQDTFSLSLAFFEKIKQKGCYEDIIRLSYSAINYVSRINRLLKNQKRFFTEFRQR